MLIQRVSLGVALSFAASSLLAQVPAAPAGIDTTAFNAFSWREIGPYRGGRSVAVAGSVARPNEYYMGTTGGGVFKSSDGGITWRPTTDGFFGGTIGAIAVSESNPAVVYVGGGESPIRGNVSHGDGVYRSDDGGKVWTYIGLVESRQISRVRVHPSNPDIVYVGAQGHAFAPNAERGVYRSTDGGKNWKKILFRNDSTGITDLVMDPSNPRVLYAAFWQSGRKPWLLSSGGVGSGIFKTNDGGDTWKELTKNAGMPKGIIGKIGIAVSPVMSSRVWAIIENDSGGVYRSDDAGATWMRMNSERKLRQRAWYYSRIFADPRDSLTVYVLNTSIWRSRDGGRTFASVPDPHVDHHDLWIAADMPQRMINANDGGANVSINGGESWTAQTFATGQFYHVSTTTDFPYRVCGAQQDNTSICGPSASPGGIHFGDWKNAGGCESGYVVPRPDRPNIIYAGCAGVFISRTDLRTGFEKDITPWPVDPTGHPSQDMKYRMQWTTPIALSPHDPNVLYAGANVLFRSTDEGMSWKAISPDLTRHDPATLGRSGGPIAKDHSGVETYATIFTIAESPKAKGTIWTGSDDGFIHISRDNGGTWTNVTPKEVGDFTRISMIEPSPHAASTAYAAVNRYQLDDLRPYIFVTHDYGRIWKRIDDSINANEFVRVVREDPVRKGLLYAGSERGVWVSFDDGGHWQRLQRNLPPVPVHDLVVKDNDLVIATHGRSFWIMDDIATLRTLTPEAIAGASQLFAPASVVRASFGAAAPQLGMPGGQNPPFGAIIDYWLSSADQTVTLEFFDGTGSLIKTFTSAADTSASVIRREQREEEEAPAHPGEPRLPNKKGMNRFVWNLKYPDAAWFRGMVLWSGFLQGPVAIPGTYTVKLTVADTAESQTFTVRNDPRSTATQADLEAQFKLMIQIRDAASSANNGVRTSRNVKAQVASAIAKTNDARLEQLAATLSAKLDAVEAELYSVQNRAPQDMLNYPIKLNDQLGALYNSVASADGKPTAQEYEVFRELSAQLRKQIGALNQALGADLASVNSELARLQMPAIVPGTADLSMRVPR
jgi:photosystem II stability/assembly factor-like uncharacterized protein